MKKLNKTYLFFLVLFVCISFTLVTGCSSHKSDKADQVRQSIHFSGYPMDAEDQTISWYVSVGYLLNSVYVSAEQSPFHKWLQEALGVKIEWQFPIRGVSPDQAIKLVFASRDLPDIFYGSTLSNPEFQINEGTYRDLSPYLEKWSPAYWNWLHSNPAYDRAMKTFSGKYYAYGFFREDGGWNDTYLGPVVNKTWLDECGLTMPKTVSDWDRTIRIFKQRYGAALSFAWSRVSGYSTFISGAWGAYASTTYRLYIDKNQKIQLANIQPEYRNQLSQLAAWWKDGLIDQDVLYNNEAMTRTNALNKKMGISFTSMGQLSNWIADARSQNTGAEWVGLGYPSGDDGTLVQVPGGYGIGNYAAVITSACPDEKLELVMRMLDYAYTPEGHLFWNYGKQGVSWDFDSYGKPAYLPLVTDDTQGLNNAIDKFSGTVWNGNCIQATAMVKMKNTPEAIAANDLWYYPNQDLTYYHNLPNGLMFTPEESDRLNGFGAIAPFVNEASIRFITGQVNLNTWDSYVAQINSMGLPELLKIYQAAYDRYRLR